MAVRRDAVVVNHVNEYLVSSAGAGASRTTVLTARPYLTLPFDTAEVIFGLRVGSLDINGQLLLQWQHSLDAAVWKPNTPIVIRTVTSASSTPEDYIDSLTTSTQLLPFGRILASVSATSGSAQITAVISVWAIYKSR